MIGYRYDTLLLDETSKRGGLVNSGSEVKPLINHPPSEAESHVPNRRPEEHKPAPGARLGAAMPYQCGFQWVVSNTSALTSGVAAPCVQPTCSGGQ